MSINPKSKFRFPNTVCNYLTDGWKYVGQTTMRQYHCIFVCHENALNTPVLDKVRQVFYALTGLENAIKRLKEQ